MFVAALILAAAIFSGGWWFSRPVPGLWRWVLRVLLLVLLVGMVLPPEVINQIRDLLARLLPLSREISEARQASFLLHGLLFGLLSFFAFWLRPDFAWQRLLVLLVALAFITEGLQLLVDGRYASWLDFGLNLAGVVGGGLLALAARWSGQRR